MYKSTARNKRHHDIDLKDDLQKIKEVLAATVRDVKGKTAETFNQSIENVKERTTDLHDNTRDYIAEKPFVSIGVALLSGVVLGYLLNGKGRDSH